MTKRIEAPINTGTDWINESRNQKSVYDNPTKFGEELARRHTQMLNEALQTWSQASRKSEKAKVQRKSKAS
ncbi:MAG: hypothetical protein J0L63_18250 [Anaerolineae bacterium]|nr:hypothetical protein [Anaerolineae bacterium]MBN8620861.1 hypothetical protein [Anaerolineae bacterium]